MDDFFVDFDSVDKGFRKGLVDKLIVLTGTIFGAEEVDDDDDDDDDDDGDDDGFGEDDGAAKDALDEKSFGVIPTFFAEVTDNLATGFDDDDDVEDD